MNNYGAKDFLVARFEALRARRNELAAIIRPLTEHFVGAPDQDRSVSSLDLADRRVSDPVPAAVLFRGWNRG